MKRLQLVFQHQISRSLLRAALVLGLTLWASWPFDISAQESKSESTLRPLRNVTVTFPAHWPPQYETGKDGKPTGFAIDVFKQVAARAGLNVTYLPQKSFSAAVEALKNGTADIIPNSGIVKERLKEFAFTTPVETFTVALFVRDDTQDIHGVEDLAGRRLAVVKTNIGLFLFKDRKDIDIHVYNDVRTALFELVAGHVDALVYPRPVIMSMLENADISHRVKVVGKPLKEIRRGIRVRKESVELLALLNPAVESFVGTPAYQDIYTKWYGKPSSYWTATKVAWAMGGFLTVVVLSMFGWRHWTVVCLRASLKIPTPFIGLIES